MPSGSADSLDELPEPIHGLLDTARRAVMMTLGNESLHAVPVVFAVVANEIVSPIDHKPKSGKTLARVKNLARDNRVTLLIDEWHEDWPRLAWLMVQGTAVVDTDAPIEDMRAINSRYPQYAANERHDALIRIAPARLLWWAWS